MGKLFKNNYKILYKNIFLLGVLGLILMFCLAVGYLNLNTALFTSIPIVYLHKSIQVGLPLFIFFLFFSYEYFMRAKDTYLDETVASIYGGRYKLYLSQCGVLTSLALILTAIPLTYGVAYYYIYGINNSVFLVHVFLNYLLNVLLSSIAAILLALLCSLFFKRVTTYGVFIVLSFLAAPISDRSLFLLSHNIGIDLTLSKKFLNIFHQNNLFFPDSIYGLPLEQFRWSLIFLYIFLLLFLCLWKLKVHKRKIARWGMAVLCTGVLFFGYDILTPGSLQRMEPDLTNFVISDQLYYIEEDVKTKKEDATFSISSYDMVFDIGKDLSATVTIRLQNEESTSKYIFTLYHNLQVESVTDGVGNTLAFTREGDYLEINSSGKSLEAITIRYHGFYPDFYSNTQGIWLGADLYYYPVEGYQIVWNEYPQGFSYNMTLPERDFSITVHSPLTVYCSLNGENNVFSGKAKAVTLAGGLFYQEYKTAGFTAYASCIDSNIDLSQYEPFSQTVQNYEKLLGAKIDLGDIIKVFFASDPIHNGDRNEIVAFGDHILMMQPWSVDQMAAQLLIARLPNDTQKDTLRYGLLSYLINRTQTIASVDATFGNSDTFQLPQGYSKENLEQTDIDSLETKFWMNKKVKTMSEKSFYSKIYAFLADENDHTPELEFIKNLK